MTAKEEEIRLQEESEKLLREAKQNLPTLKLLLADMSGHWCYEDPIYRLYHHSFKVYWMQTLTETIVMRLRELAPHLPLNPDFLAIIEDGTGKRFEHSHNQDWLRHTRPIVEAFFHARHMLEMVCKYAEELSAPPQTLPYGWATVLYLYNLR